MATSIPEPAPASASRRRARPDVFDLAKILRPITARHFFASYWEQRPLVIHRKDRRYFRKLFSMDAVDRLITTTDLRFPAVRLVKKDASIPVEDYTVEIPWGGTTFNGVALVDRVMAEYHQGTTVILQALHRNWPAVARLCRNLEAQLTHPVHANAYVTPRRAQGFAAHFDTHDVFILAVAGVKRWRIYGSPVTLPARGFVYDAKQHPPGRPLLEFDLKPGSTVYIPRGYIHEAVTSDRAALHITVGISAFTWLDALSEAVVACRADPRFRRNLPIGFADEPTGGAARQFRTLVRHFAATVDAAAILEYMAEKFVHGRPPLLQGYLDAPDTVQRTSLDTFVRRRAGLLFRVGDTKDGVTLRFHGKRIAFPAHARSAVRFVTTHERFRVRSIGDGLDDEGKLVLVRRLIREGFLAVA